MRTSYDRTGNNKQEVNPVNRRVESAKTDREYRGYQGEYSGGYNERHEGYQSERSEEYKERPAVSGQVANSILEIRQGLDNKYSELQLKNGGQEWLNTNNQPAGYGQEPAWYNPEQGMQQQGYTENNPPKNKKSHKGLVIGIIIVFIIIALAATAFVLWKKGIIFNNEGSESEQPESTTEPYVPQIDLIQEDVNALYTDDTKSDIIEGVSTSDLDPLYDRLYDAELNGEDVSAVVSELDVISSYISDRDLVSELEAEDVDVSSDEFYSKATELRLKVETYGTGSLSQTLLGRINALLEVRDNYFMIKMQLLGVTDLLSFNADEYREQIKTKITSAVNAEELLLLLDKVEGDSMVAKAEAALETAEDVESAQIALDGAKAAQAEREKAWLIYTGQYTEEATEASREG